MTTPTVNFGLYFQTTQWQGVGGVGVSIFHTCCWFAALFFPQCQHIKKPVLKFSVSGSWSCSLPCVVPVPSASSTPWPIQSLTASFLPKLTFWLWGPPSLSWSFPWVAEWRLALESILACYIPVAQCFLMIVLNTTGAVNVLHRCITGSRTVGLGNPMYVIEATV